MSEHLHDIEQAERVKKWIKTYTWPVVIGVVIALVGNWGWDYWQQQRKVQSEHAANSYLQFLGQSVSQPLEVLTQQAEIILTTYSKTPYATMTALLLAQKAVDVKDNVLAIEQLNWVVSNTQDDLLRQLALIRMARIQIAEGKISEALALLDEADKDVFVSYQLEVKADALVAQGNTEEAKTLYQQALEALPENMNHGLLTLKLAELGVPAA